jgi:hypothetical protein
MKIPFSLVSLAIALVALTVISHGQVSIVDPASTRSIVVTITPQADSPLVVSTGVSRMAPLGVTLRVENSSDRPVKAFVLAIDAGGKRSTYTSVRPKRPVEPGKFVNQGVASKGADNIEITLDHVLFTDGSTWGADVFGRAKMAAAYLDGHDLAITRLRSLLAGTDAADFLAPLERFGGYTFGSPVSADRPGAEGTAQNAQTHRRGTGPCPQAGARGTDRQSLTSFR